MAFIFGRSTNNENIFGEKLYDVKMISFSIPNLLWEFICESLLYYIYNMYITMGYNI